MVVTGRVGARKLVVDADRAARALGVRPGLALAVVSADAPLQRLDLVAKDVLAQEGDLAADRVLGQVDPPSSGLAAVTPAPAVAAALERVLVFEGAPSAQSRKLG